MVFIREFIAFLRQRKKFWLLPIIVLIVLLGLLLIAAENSMIAPLIYPLF